MKAVCPKCQALVPSEQINVAADVAHCKVCGELFALSDLVAQGAAVDEGFDISKPPKGVWFQETFDGWVLGATTRSAIAFFLVPFMCVWSGFSLGGIYGTQIAKGEFNLMMSLFGIPFVLGSILFWSIALMAVCGKTVVSVTGGQGTIFTGVWRIGWTRRFDWSAVKGIEHAVLSRGKHGSENWGLKLVGPEPLEFGSEWSGERRQYVAGALRQLLTTRTLKPTSGANEPRW